MAMMRICAAIRFWIASCSLCGFMAVRLPDRPELWYPIGFVDDKIVGVKREVGAGLVMAAVVRIFLD